MWFMCCLCQALKCLFTPACCRWSTALHDVAGSDALTNLLQRTGQPVLLNPSSFEDSILVTQKNINGITDSVYRLKVWSLN